MRSASPWHAGFVAEKGATTRRAAALENDRGARARAAALAVLRTLLAMAVSAALCLGAVNGWERARSSPLLAVRKVSVRGAAHARPAELIARSGLLVGQNILRVDLAAAARGVESSPWVISASVSRRLPMTVEVEVVERRPAAKIVLGASYLVDVEGKVFKKVAEEDGALELPLFTGLSRADWDDRRPEAQARILLGLEFLEAWNKEGLPPQQLGELRFDNAGRITALARLPVSKSSKSGDSGEDQLVQEVRVGSGPFGAKLHRLGLVRAALARKGEQASRIDLDNQVRPDTVAAQIIPPPDRPAPRGASGPNAQE